MKRYIKPQIQVMAAVLTTEMLTGSREGWQLEHEEYMSKKNQDYLMMNGSRQRSLRQRQM